MLSLAMELHEYYDYYNLRTFWDKYGLALIFLLLIFLTVVSMIIYAKKADIKAKRAQKVEARKYKVIMTGHETVRVPRDSHFAPPILSRDGYTFSGWFMDTALTVPWISTQKVKYDMTLYPKWIKE